MTEEPTLGGVAREERRCAYPYRVFISYSHKDRELAMRLDKHLRENLGVHPVVDWHIPSGSVFSDDIKRSVSRSHVFVSLLTTNSKESPWAHQELGYAMGFGVPILPLALDQLPAGMASELQALFLEADLRDLESRLTAEQLDSIVSQSRNSNRAMFECAMNVYERTKKLIDYSQSLGSRVGKLRQRSAFSSFSIPNKGPRHVLWDRRESGHSTDESVRSLLRRERIALQTVAVSYGCDLIIDPWIASPTDPSGPRLKYSDQASVERLRQQRDFLTDSDDKVRVVMRKGEIDSNVTILGDWVSATAVVPHYKTGYKQTIFTWHAPTVLEHIQDFDRDFQDALDEAGLTPAKAKAQVIATMEQIMGKQS